LRFQTNCSTRLVLEQTTLRDEALETVDISADGPEVSSLTTLLGAEDGT
jgi:hypothetical protein